MRIVVENKKISNVTILCIYDYSCIQVKKLEAHRASFSTFACQVLQLEYSHFAVYSFILAHMCTYTHIHMNMHRHMCVRIYIYIYIYIYAFCSIILIIHFLFYYRLLETKFIIYEIKLLLLGEYKFQLKTKFIN
jgi:hypothetical protein